jgi:copper chaperone CopZ
VKGNYVECSYIAPNGKKGIVKISAGSIPSEVTPAPGSVWISDESGEALLCDSSKCDFNVSNPVVQDMDDNKKAKEKLTNLGLEFDGFFSVLANATSPARPIGDVVINFDPPKDVINAIRAKFGIKPDGTVAETGKLFTFGIGTDEEAKAKAMANNLQFDPVKTVIKNVDGTYSVVADLTSINNILDTLIFTEELQKKSNYRSLQTREFFVMQTKITNNAQFFDHMIQKALIFLDPPKE